MITVQNGIPLSSIIIVFISAISFTIISLLLVKKYIEKPSIPLRYLMLSMISYAISAYVYGTGILMDFLGISIKPGTTNIYLTMMLEFIFIALGNVFLVVFMTYVYLDANNQVLIIMTALNSLSIGLFIPNVKYVVTVKDVNFYFPYFIIISLITYGVFIYKNQQAIKSTQNKNVIIGFRFMQLFGLFIILSFLGFTNNIRSILRHNLFFNVFFYFGYLMFTITAIMAYLGFILPSLLLKKKEK